MESPAQLNVARRLEPPAAVRDIARKLEAAGFETWCVGGAVRDALLGLRHLDWDLATAATPDQVRTIFRRTKPVGERFGTTGVLDPTGQLHEVTTFRHDVRTDGRHAEVVFGASLDEDLARRDFTINAIAYSPSSERLHDPFEGQADLARGIVRAVGEPRQRMKEDRLRALRALRFAGRFGFRIDDATWNAIVESAPALNRLSRERVQQELIKTLQQLRTPSVSLVLWERCGAFRELLPALAGPPAWRWHAADTPSLPEATLDPGRARRRTLVRLAAILSGLNWNDCIELLRGLRLSNREVDRVAHLVTRAERIRPELERTSTIPTSLELRRWASVAGRVDLADTLRVAIAAGIAEHGHGAATRVRFGATYRRALRCAYRDPVEIADLKVDGEDLMREAGIAAGPMVGAVLRQLLEWVLEDPARNHRDVLLARAREAAGAR